MKWALITHLNSEIRPLVHLALPIVITQVGQMMMGMVDIWMVSRLGTQSLAEVALGDTWAFGTLILVIGLIQGVDPLFTQAHGAQDSVSLGRTFQRGILLCILLCPLLGIAWGYTADALRFLGQSEDLLSGASSYVSAQVFSIPPLLGFFILRQYLQCRGVLAPVVWTILISNLFNVVFNELFIFGGLGFPAMGIEGAARATGASRIIMFLLLVAIVIYGKHMKNGWTPWTARSFSPIAMLRLIRYGLPVMIHFGVEVWTFQAATLMAGRLGSESLSAHILVLKIISFTFMFPWGLSGAATTRVGNLLGAGKIPAAINSAKMSLVLAFLTMLIMGILLKLFGAEVTRLFSKDTAVLALATGLLPIAAGFQVFDGIQAVSAGILRGAGLTVPAALMSLIGFPMVTIPLAYYLAFEMEWGLKGIWWAFLIGLFVMATLLTLWVRFSARSWKPIERQIG